MRVSNDDIDKIATSIVDSFKLSLDSQEKIFQSKLNAFNEQKARLVRANALYRLVDLDFSAI